MTRRYELLARDDPRLDRAVKLAVRIARANLERREMRAELEGYVSWKAMRGRGRPEKHLVLILSLAHALRRETNLATVRAIAREVRRVLVVGKLLRDGDQPSQEASIRKTLTVRKREWWR